MQCLTYPDEYVKWRQLWIEQRFMLPRVEEHLTEMCAVVPLWKSLELQKYQNYNLEEEVVEQRCLLQVQE